MKKILLALLALFCINTLSAMNPTSTEEEGRRWTVKITVQITADYYTDRYMNGYLTSQNREKIVQEVVVFARTADEAESKAKDKCMWMCSSNGEYIGTARYGSQTAHVWLRRTILTARAE